MDLRPGVRRDPRSRGLGHRAPHPAAAAATRRGAGAHSGHRPGARIPSPPRRPPPPPPSASDCAAHAARCSVRSRRSWGRRWSATRCPAAAWPTCASARGGRGRLRRVGTPLDDRRRRRSRGRHGDHAGGGGAAAHRAGPRGRRGARGKRASWTSSRRSPARRAGRIASGAASSTTSRPAWSWSGSGGGSAWGPCCGSSPAGTGTPGPCSSRPGGWPGAPSTKAGDPSRGARVEGLGPAGGSARGGHGRGGPLRLGGPRRLGALHPGHVARAGLRHPRGRSAVPGARWRPTSATSRSRAPWWPSRVGCSPRPGRSACACRSSRPSPRSCASSSVRHRARRTAPRRGRRAGVLPHRRRAGGPAAAHLGARRGTARSTTS